MRGLPRGTADAPDANLGPSGVAHQTHAAIAATPGVLAEPAVHVVLGPRVVRSLEQPVRRAHLDDVPWGLVGRQEERAVLRDAGGLLHVVRHDHNRDLLT